VFFPVSILSPAAISPPFNMLASKAATYSGLHLERALKQSSQPGGPHGTADRLLTDRSAYIAYLEAQLQRVSAACQASQSFEGRVDALERGIRRLEEEFGGMASRVAASESNSEGLRAELEALKGSMREEVERLRASAAEALERQQAAFQVGGTNSPCALNPESPPLHQRLS
jgi:hypothetical protein